MGDEKGLYLLIGVNGLKLWRLDYRIDGKRKTLALGRAPYGPIALAREKRDNACKLSAQDIDPGEQRKQDKQERRTAQQNTFEAVAHENG